MSQQQALQPQQTPLVYPISEQNLPSHHESNGSFGSVFIVLAVIVVISAIACFLGRLCNKRRNKQSKPSKHGHGHGHGHAARPPKEKDLKHTQNAFHTKDGDIEFGFDKRFSSAKVAANGEPTMGRPNSFREHNMGPNMGRPNAFQEPNMGRTNSFREPTMGRPNSFPKGEFRGDHQVRFGGGSHDHQDHHEMDFKSGMRPEHY